MLIKKKKKKRETRSKEMRKEKPKGKVAIGQNMVQNLSDGSFLNWGS